MEFTLWVNITISEFRNTIQELVYSENLCKYYTKIFSEYCNGCIDRYNEDNYELESELKGLIMYRYNCIISNLKNIGTKKKSI